MSLDWFMHSLVGFLFGLGIAALACLRKEEGGRVFDLGFTTKDLVRVAWTFVQGVLGYGLAVVIGWVPGSAFDWRAFGVGLLAAGISAVKNLVLSDTSRIK